MDNRNYCIYLHNLVGLCWIRLFTINDVVIYTWITRIQLRTKDNNKHLTKLDYTLFIFIIVLAIIGIVRLITGNISVF